MLTQKLRALEAAKARVAHLEAALAKEQERELARLPAKFGFSAVGEFIRAVLAASRKTRPAAATTAHLRRKRAVITKATRVAVKNMIESGKTAKETARMLGLSVSSVHNIKKTLKLVRPRP